MFSTFVHNQLIVYTISFVICNNFLFTEMEVSGMEEDVEKILQDNQSDGIQYQLEGMFYRAQYYYTFLYIFIFILT